MPWFVQSHWDLNGYVGTVPRTAQSKAKPLNSVLGVILEPRYLEQLLIDSILLLLVALQHFFQAL